MTDEYDGPDLEALDLPDNELYEEWEWQHRRAYFYRQIMERGHHRLVNKSELAEQFGVTRKTIYRDLDKISWYIEDNMSARHEAEGVQVFQTAVRELLDDGEYKQAADVQAQFSSWLANRGELDREPEQHEVSWRDFISE